MRQKTVQSVFGYLRNCPSFQACPLCYGCRAYDSKYTACEACRQAGEKYHLCNTAKHKNHLLDKMIQRECITIQTEEGSTNGETH